VTKIYLKGGSNMKLIRQFAIISIICFLGEVIRSLLGIAIPGNVIGMILLLVLLCSGIIKLEAIEDISKFLLDHLPFFFVPAGVGLIASVGIIKDCWQYIILIIVISTIVVMTVTSITVQLFKRS
jgi:holin-like protein